MGQQVSQRDRLLTRTRPTIVYRLLVDGEAVVAARAALAEAQHRERQVRLSSVGKRRDAALRRARQAVVEAQAQVDACYEPIVLQALEPGELEALIAAHPPTPEQWRAAEERAQQRGEQPDWPDWNPDTFRPALLAACAVEAGMTADDWAAFLRSNVSAGEQAALWRAAMEVNHRERIADPLVLPKGWTEMISSR